MVAFVLLCWLDLWCLLRFSFGFWCLPFGLCFAFCGLCLLLVALVCGCFIISLFVLLLPWDNRCCLGLVAESCWYLVVFVCLFNLLCLILVVFCCVD